MTKIDVEKVTAYFELLKASLESESVVLEVVDSAMALLPLYADKSILEYTNALDKDFFYRSLDKKFQGDTQRMYGCLLSAVINEITCTLLAVHVTEVKTA